MKKFINLTVAALMTTALNVTSCTTQNTTTEKGRVIEFTSKGDGFHTKTIFYEGKEDVIAFDAQFTSENARMAIDHLRKFTKKPISWLVITHPNPDKFNGARVFGEQGAKIIASKATKTNMKGVHAYKKYYFVHIAKMFTDKTYPKIADIDETFEQNVTLRLKGGENVELIEYLKPGISTNQTIAVLPGEQGLVVGDLIHHKAHSWLEGGITRGEPQPNLQKWRDLLGEIRNDFSLELDVYGGRGEVAKLGTVSDSQIHYLDRSEQIVEKYIEELGELVMELKGQKASIHYKKLADIFTREFPDHELPYLIEYGIYGLVNSKL